MSDQDTAQEKTEAATPRRIEQAREKGDVPRSRELSTAVMLIVGMASLLMLGPSAVSTYKGFSHDRWSLERQELLDPAAIMLALSSTVSSIMWMLAPFLCVMFLAAFVAPLLMGGWAFSVSQLKPDIKKLDPLKGLKRMFGPQGLMELFKALLKMVLLGLIAVLMLSAKLEALLALAIMPLGDAVNMAFRIVFVVVFALCLVVVLTAIIDVPWQRFQYAKKLRMTRQQVKEEGKETTGNPEVKNKVRSLQQAVSQRRMLLDVPTANVIIVNPTHFSVALRYDDELDAPEVVAKGVDHMALRIREIGRASDVMIFSAPLLARALYRHAEVGRQIPTELYVAVAKVLAYVYQVQNASFNDRRQLKAPDHLEIPPEMRDPGPPGSASR